LTRLSPALSVTRRRFTPLRLHYIQAKEHSDVAPGFSIMIHFFKTDDVGRGRWYTRTAVLAHVAFPGSSIFVKHFIFSVRKLLQTAWRAPGYGDRWPGPESVSKGDVTECCLSPSSTVPAP